MKIIQTKLNRCIILRYIVKSINQRFSNKRNMIYIFLDRSNLINIYTHTHTRTQYKIILTLGHGSLLTAIAAESRYVRVRVRRNRLRLITLPSPPPPPPSSTSIPPSIVNSLNSLSYMGGKRGEETNKKTKDEKRKRKRKIDEIGDRRVYTTRIVLIQAA